MFVTMVNELKNTTMQPFSVSLKWTEKQQVNEIMNNIICRTSGIYEIYIRKGSQDSLVYVGKADYSFLDSLLMITGEKWFRENRDNLYVRLGLIASPIRWNSDVLTNIHNSLVMQFHPSFNAAPAETVCAIA